MQEYQKGRHKVLQDLSDETVKGFIDETYEVWNRKWVLKTLNDGELSWANRFISSNSQLSYITSRRAATLAVSIRALNDVSLDELFEFQAETEAEQTFRDYVMNDEVRRRFWLAEQMYAYLEEQPEDLVFDLYAKYEDLLKRQKEVLVNLKNSLTRTPTSV